MIWVANLSIDTDDQRNPKEARGEISLVDKNKYGGRRGCRVHPRWDRTKVGKLLDDIACLKRMT